MKREERLGDGGLMPDARRQRTMTPQFVPLREPLTSTSWDGDSHSTTAKTLIDLSVVFGVPANVRAVLVRIAIQDSGAAGADTWFMLSPNNLGAPAPGLDWSCLPANDRFARYGGVVVPCNADGDIYYRVNASGALTMDVFIEVWGYFL